MFRSLPRVASVALVALFIGAGAEPASAEDIVASTSLTHALLFPVAPIAPTAIAAAEVEAKARTARVQPSPMQIVPTFDERRPALLPAMYAATVALQALDAHSTYRAIDRGAQEANPVMKGIVGNKGAMLAVKAGVAASTIWMAEKMWRRNKTGAIVLMAVVNGVTAAVVANNYRVAQQLAR